MMDISKEVVDALLQGVTEGPISDQHIKYENVCAHIAAGKASQQDAIDAIRQLCADNERLAVLAGKSRAALDEAEAERDAANALLREIELHLAKISGFWFDTFPRKEIRAHLGAKL